MEKSSLHAKYLSLPAKDQEYLIQRMHYFGKEMDIEEKEQLEGQDLIHGWPTMEMPDTSGMDRAARKEIKTVYKGLKHAMDEVNKSYKIHKQALKNAEDAAKEKEKAQYLAALVAATDWKQALAKVKGQTS